MIADQNNWEGEHEQSELENKLDGFFKDGRPSSLYSERMLSVLEAKEAAVFGIIAEAYYYRYFLSYHGFKVSQDTTREVLEELHSQAIHFLAIPPIPSKSHPGASHDTALRFLMAYYKYEDSKVLFEYIRSATQTELYQLAFVVFAKAYKQEKQFNEQQLLTEVDKNLLHPYVGEAACELLIEIGTQEAVALIKKSFGKLSPASKEVVMNRGLAKSDDPFLQQAVFDLIPHYAQYDSADDTYVTIYQIYSDTAAYIDAEIRKSSGYQQRRGLEKLVNSYRFYQTENQVSLFKQILFDESIAIGGRILFCEEIIKNETLYRVMSEVISSFAGLAAEEIKRTENQQEKYKYEDLNSLLKEKKVDDNTRAEEEPEEVQWYTEWGFYSA